MNSWTERRDYKKGYRMAGTIGPDWNRLENLHVIALDHLDRWSKAARTQATRATDETAGDTTRISDGYMFSQALRQVIRAAELLAKTLPEIEERNTVTRALDKFKSDVPDAVNILDILDHFDDYARGLGRLTRHLREKRKSNEPSEEYARMLEPMVEIEDTEVTISCGKFTIDISTATAALEQLVSDILDAIGYVKADESSLYESIGDLNPENPVAVAFAVFTAVMIEPEGDDEYDVKQYALEVLRSLVTPESLESWGDFERIRTLMHGYAIGSTPDIDDNIAYVKFVPEPPEGRVATRPILFTNALWATLVYRPDLGGGWYLHSIGRRLERSELFGES